MRQTASVNSSISPACIPKSTSPFVLGNQNDKMKMKNRNLLAIDKSVSSGYFFPAVSICTCLCIGRARFEILSRVRDLLHTYIIGHIYCNIARSHARRQDNISIKGTYCVTIERTYEKASESSFSFDVVSYNFEHFHLHR